VIIIHHASNLIFDFLKICSETLADLKWKLFLHPDTNAYK